jgi:hypothetical protein
MLRWHWFTKQLEKAPPFPIALFGGAAAFLTYFSMFGFRKPFTAATFEEHALFGMDFKTVLVISQVLGYMTAKLIGIKVVAEMKSGKRFLWLTGCILMAEVALAGLAIVPAPYNFLFLFLNGLPLGFIYGIVFSYLEGRRSTETMGAMLILSFIVATGVSKSAGLYFMGHWNLTVFEMPVVTGLVFLVPFLLGVWALEHLPPPSEADRRERVVRLPMPSAERRAFFRSLAPGILALVVAYVVLTALRDFRDNFAVEIMKENDIINPEIFSRMEILIGISILLSLALMSLIRNHKKAFFLNVLMICGGACIALGATLAFSAGVISAEPWMILLGFGLYLGYVPYNCMMFERLIALRGIAATAGFLLYLSDFSGYVGSVSVMLFRQTHWVTGGWTVFCVKACYAGCVLLIGGSILAFFYFWRKFSVANPNLH